MKQLTPEQKHSILTHYTSPNNTQTLDEILSLHDIHISRRSVELWRQRWNGTIESLQHKFVPGRPHILTHKEVTQHITTPIRRKNRAYKKVKYSQVAEHLRENTGKTISDRTVRRIGKQELSAAKSKGRKRTAEESEYLNICVGLNNCVVIHSYEFDCLKFVC